MHFCNAINSIDINKTFIVMYYIPLLLILYWLVGYGETLGQYLIEKVITTVIFYLTAFIETDHIYFKGADTEARNNIGKFYWDGI